MPEAVDKNIEALAEALRQRDAQEKSSRHREQRKAPQILELAEACCTEFGGPRQVAVMLKELYEQDNTPSGVTKVRVVRLLESLFKEAARIRSRETTEYELLSSEDLVRKLRETLGELSETHSDPPPTPAPVANPFEAVAAGYPELCS